MKTAYIYIFTCLILVCITSCTDKNSIASSTKKYFDLEGYFKNEALRYAKENALLNKTVVNNNQIETKNNLQVDWMKELNIFIASDINKPAWKISYSTDTLLRNDTLFYTYKALEDKLKIRFIQITLDTQKQTVTSIHVHQFNTNNLYQSERMLHYVSDKYYRIDGSLMIRGMKKNSFRIEAQIL